MNSPPQQPETDGNPGRDVGFRPGVMTPRERTQRLRRLILVTGWTLMTGAVLGVLHAMVVYTAILPLGSPWGGGWVGLAQLLLLASVVGFVTSALSAFVVVPSVFSRDLRRVTRYVGVGSLIGVLLGVLTVLCAFILMASGGQQPAGALALVGLWGVPTAGYIVGVVWACRRTPAGVWQPTPSHGCARCGYDLSGLALSAPCPECGTVVHSRRDGFA